MAHIELTSKELAYFSKLDLPEGTTIIEGYDSDAQTEDIYSPIKSYIVENKILKVQRDWVEYNRKFTPEEEKEYKSKITKQSSVDFFLDNKDFEPQREYSANSSKEYELFNNIRHAGKSRTLKDGRKFCYYQISINPGDNLNDVKNEYSFWLSNVKARFPDLKKIKLDIFEKTLGARGYYQLVILSNKYKIKKTTYGFTSTIKSFINLDDTLKYIQDKLWYK